ncbi:MAG: gluconate 2-dehydrogenase subunit 3 family protein [Sphingobacteriia bacterium]|nr:MAG: gluconate 2-dehydrogenase subunit 3 family protein [Sphingobacteriia bacterium]TAH08866.1 MAG: gluconate 2-dehydrogenase subunit 3 family protein [Sphingobacteriia bacterium]
MQLHRRHLLKHFAVISAGVLLLPACKQKLSNAAIPLKNIQLNADSEALLLALSESILPKTNTQGAKELAASAFAVKMLDDCYSPEAQKKFMEGLEQFESYAKESMQKSFVICDEAQKASLLTTIELEKVNKEPLEFFYFTFKKHIVQAYTSSEYFMTKVQGYEMIPGRFHGCVPVKKSVKAS